nr:MAG TPA: hypothetical protein [Caudoviricetes sp.]
MTSCYEADILITNRENPGSKVSENRNLTSCSEPDILETYKAHSRT